LRGLALGDDRDATRAITVVAESETTQPIYLPLVMRNF